MIVISITLILKADEPETITSSLGWNANGCGSPVLNRNGLIVTAAFSWSI